MVCKLNKHKGQAGKKSDMGRKEYMEMRNLLAD